jgi:hypothetical protein
VKDILISLIVASVIAIPALLAMIEQDKNDFQAQRKKRKLVKKLKFSVN